MMPRADRASGTSGTSGVSATLKLPALAARYGHDTIRNWRLIAFMARFIGFARTVTPSRCESVP
ncbi:hypothetical protein WT27_02665 [Burkholderia territorii]|uniref:Uncharacterized protein n=1 Tax=Burkholderia territorii TaxID=1503055 RepID=A0A119AUW8_9BURK|nr:hypothetical protein WT27_02665 [Burkholderia territorii]KVX46435.1 hypothetical protein WT31_22150 [Burkholderia territorii]